MTLQKDSLVVFKKKPAKVLACSDKIELEIADGGNKSVREKDVLFLHPGPVKNPDIKTLDAPDIDETLEMLAEDSVTFEDFAALLYGEFTPEAAWSAWQMLDEGRYFTGDMQNITARDMAEIEAGIAAERERETAKRQRAEFIERVRNGALLPEDMVHMRDVENLALGKSAGSGVLRDLSMEQSPEKAHQLLLKTGVWDCMVNPHPSRAGIPLENPEFPVPELPDEEREDLRHQQSFAIDDENSNDPDDAIACADGLLWVHVADVAALVAPGSDIDKEAETRGANLYVPEKVVHMLPETLTAKLALGLDASSEAVALSFGIEINDDGTPVLKRVVPSRIKVTRVSYAEAENMLDSGALAEIDNMLERFRRKRIQSGAVNIDLPEVKISLHDGKVVIKSLPRLNSRELVADAMIAAGAAAGAYAYEHDIPVPYAVQPAPEENTSVGDTLAGMFALRRTMSAAGTQLEPGAHSGLGVDMYIRITSPLRRYSDLLAHQQFRAHLRGAELMSHEDLSGKIAVAERASQLLRKTERIANEFWKLVFFMQNPDWKGTAMAVDKQDDRVTLLVPELAYEFKSHLGSKTELNTVFNIGVNAVDLPGLSGRFKINHQAMT
jgi:exoribonuclease-2